MVLAPQHIETLEKAGGFILEQLVTAGAITTEQQSAILAQQQQIEQETGEKPVVGQLLEQNGIDTSPIQQPLLDLQASARSLLHAYGEREATQRCEGPSGAIDLRAGVPDKKWTAGDMESGDPAKEQTALLQTRLLQTKVLTAAADMLAENGQEIPESTINALRASQDAAREGFGAAIQTLRQAGQTPDALEAAHAALPQPDEIMPQPDIHTGISDAIGQLQQTGLLDLQQAQTLRMQELKRSNDISTLQTRRLARDIGKGGTPTAPNSQPTLGAYTAMANSPRGQGGGLGV